MDPDGRLLVQMDLGRYRIVNLKDQKEKHVFMNQVDIPEGSKDGVYSARITLSDGTVYTASDHVHIATMDRAGGLRPGNNEETTDPPAELRWDPVPGARYYQVFIKDQWNDGKQIYSSEVLSEPLLTLPQGLLKKGGLYSWFVHSRDVNEDPLLGDFNHGSLSSPVEFSVSD